MPQRPKRLCGWPGCRALVRDGRCPRHAEQQRREENAARPADHNRRLGRRWKERIRPQILLRDLYTCQACGRQVGLRPGDAHVDHRIPTSAGGTDELENLQTLCAGCHNQKTNTQDGGLGHEGGRGREIASD